MVVVAESDRTWKCNSCGTTLDRDINAAINLRNMAVGHTVSAHGEVSSGIEVSQYETDFVELGIKQDIGL